MNQIKFEFHSNISTSFQEYMNQFSAFSYIFNVGYLKLTDKRVNELYFGLLNKVIQDKLVSSDLLLQLVISILQGCYSDKPTMLKSVQIGVAN